ncbi:hypothetical protein B0H66DRAFT_526949 [Apodospora peruviana]|uniref:PNPLA domain-containing protein n=1 Tax=Apodospora peruviana TaxID=516989 RepID=A0AAE0IR86_9PEZI|nr:hypothetical protein B0H66DRAFT_526949 [Apodospora peruviana]
MPPHFENGPYNLLSLDGGGVRGVSTLVILHRIMEKIQKKEELPELPKPCEYFHLIGGTSTGGLIAILLGRLRMSTTEAMAEYDSFARAIFRKKNLRASVSARFNEEALVRAVRKIVKRTGDDELMKDPAGDRPMGKTFVCALPAQSQRAPKRIRAYHSDDDWDNNFKIWEAARATTAAPSYFRSITLGSVELIDAAMGFNNPMGQVVDEAGKIFDLSCKLGCVVSLGTGTRDKNLGMPGGVKRLLQTVKLMKNITTDSDRVEDDIKERFSRIPSTYFRFSVPGAAETVGMTEYKKIGELKDMTLEYLNSTAERDIEEVSDRLANGASSGWSLGNLFPNEEFSRVDNQRANSGGIASNFFTGRNDILDRLSTFFEKRENNPVPRREFLLYGLPGVGKTQIALKFRQMMEKEDRFQRLFFVDATDIATVEESYGRVAAELGLSEANAVPQVLNWMTTIRMEWLLILDNCGDQDLSRFLPNSDRGNVIYTSRYNVLKLGLPQDAVAEVDVLEEKDAIDLLLKVTHEPPEGSEALHTLALQIVKELGCLPLAIEQAGAYIYTYHYTLADYLEVYPKQKATLMKISHYSRASQRDQAVYTTFDVSYEELRRLAKRKRGFAEAETAEMAMKILNFICFYHNENIMEAIVEKAAEFRWSVDRAIIYPLGSRKYCLEDVLKVNEAGDWEPTPFRKAAILLESLSLVRRDRTGSLSMHVLVHSWARDRMSEDDRASFSQNARTLLFNSLKDITVAREVSRYRRRAYPHVIACQKLVQAPQGHPEQEVEHRANLALMLEAISLPRAEKEWEQVISEYTIELTGDATYRWFPMRRLAHVYESQARWRPAFYLRKEVWEEQLSILGPTHPMFIGTSFQLAAHCLLFGNPVMAWGFWEPAGYLCAHLCGKKRDPELLRWGMQLAKEISLMMDDALSLADKSVGTPEAGRMDHGGSEGRVPKVGHPIPADGMESHTDGGRNDHASTSEPDRMDHGGQKPPVAKVGQSVPTYSMDGHHSPSNSMEREAKLWQHHDENVDIYGPYSVQAIMNLEMIGSGFFKQSRGTCCEIVATEGIRRALKQLEPSHHCIARLLETLARAYIMDGLFHLAAPLQEAVVQRLTASCGRESMFTLVARCNLNGFNRIKAMVDGRVQEVLEKKAIEGVTISETMAREIRRREEKRHVTNRCDKLPCGRSGHRDLRAQLAVSLEDPLDTMMNHMYDDGEEASYWAKILRLVGKGEVEEQGEETNTDKEGVDEPHTRQMSPNDENGKQREFLGNIEEEGSGKPLGILRVDEKGKEREVVRISDERDEGEPSGGNWKDKKGKQREWPAPTGVEEKERGDVEALVRKLRETMSIYEQRVSGQ